MKPDRIQFAPWLGNGQARHQIVAPYKVDSLNQAAILSGVFSDLIEDPSAQQVVMIVERQQLTVIVAAAAGGPLTGAELALIEGFDSIYAMVIDDLFEAHEEDDVD